MGWVQPTRNNIGRAPISSLVDERNGCSRGQVETSGLAVWCGLTSRCEFSGISYTQIGEGAFKWERIIGISSLETLKWWVASICC